MSVLPMEFATPRRQDLLRLACALCVFGFSTGCLIDLDSEYSHDVEAGGCTPDNPTGTCAGGEICNNGVCETEPILIDLDGVLDVHPVSLAFNTQGGMVAPSVSWGAAGEVIVSLYDSTSVSGAQGDITQVTALGTFNDLSSCTVGTFCPISFTDVDISGLSVGLIALIFDMRAQPDFVPSNVGIFGDDTVIELKANPQDYNAAAPFFAITDQSVGVMANFSSHSHAEIIQNGSIFGMQFGTTSAPEPGVTVELSSDYELIYPNDTFTAPQTDTTTNVAGFFFAVSNTGGSGTAVLSACGHATLKWPDRTVGTGPGSVFVLSNGACPDPEQDCQNTCP